MRVQHLEDVLVKVEISRKRVTHESSEDIAALQRLLDESYASAGEHLKSIHYADNRLSAEEVCD